MKAKPLLLDILFKHKVITTKSTNATNNKLKEEAWKLIAQEFCALMGESRRPEQLRLKWENLKKFARKRSALIRQNNIKTGGGKTFIAPDEVLDRLASVLGVTCTGLSVEFSGDGDNEAAVGLVSGEAVVEVLDFQPLPELPNIAPSSSSSVVVLGGECGDGGLGGGSEAILTPKKNLFNTPSKGCKLRLNLFIKDTNVKCIKQGFVYQIEEL